MVKRYIGSKEFNSIKESYEYAKNKIYKFGEGEFYQESKQYLFLNDLLKNHEDYDRKVGTGILYFIIQKNKWGSSLETVIMRTDKSTESFSWNKCAKSICTNNNEKLEKAMRYSIKSQIEKYKQDNYDSECNICKEFDNSYEIDHIKEFSVLKKQFLDMCNNFNIAIPTTFNKGFSNTDIFKKKDSLLEKKWVNYHKENAQLQKICKKCHKEKTKNMYKK
jgi:hypothetical protein